MPRSRAASACGRSSLLRRAKWPSAAPERLEIAACAVELIHAYSLVHDDMPCMDNDVLRRGKPTVHVEYDEATALLVGDALQSLAFQLLAEQRLADDARVQLDMVKTLAVAAGSRGMAGGQQIDLESTGKALTLPELEVMHIHKTGALIRARSDAGRGVRTGRSGPEKFAGQVWQSHRACVPGRRRRARLRREHRTLGKTAGKDARQGKPTYVSTLGLARRARAGGRAARRGARGARAPRRRAPAPRAACRLHRIAKVLAMNAITGGLPHDAYNASMYELLKTIDDPAQLRALDRKQLRQLADELRAFVLESVSKTGGHLSSNLGTVELTIALHYVFDTPEDRIVWDVGHQTYPHKILTGRREAMARAAHARRHLAAFRAAPRSKYDTFGTAHSSTSISAALGMAVAAKLKSEKRHCIAVIGDGAMIGRHGLRGA